LQVAEALAIFAAAAAALAGIEIQQVEKQQAVVAVLKV
jgi:hypothetical protein